MKQKVIICPAIKKREESGKRGICTCNCDGIKCNGSYNADGSRIPIRRSLPYQGIARRALNKEYAVPVRHKGETKFIYVGKEIHDQILKMIDRDDELTKANSDHLGDCDCFLCKRPEGGCAVINLLMK